MFISHIHPGTSFIRSIPIGFSAFWRVCFVSAHLLVLQSLLFFCHVLCSIPLKKKKKIYLAAPGLNCSTWDLVSWPGIKPQPTASGAWSFSHWTTKKSLFISFIYCLPPSPLVTWMFWVSWLEITQEAVRMVGRMSQLLEVGKVSHFFWDYYELKEFGSVCTSFKILVKYS